PAFLEPQIGPAHLSRTREQEERWPVLPPTARAQYWRAGKEEIEKRCRSFFVVWLFCRKPHVVRGSRTAPRVRREACCCVLRAFLTTPENRKADMRKPRRKATLP